MNLNEIFKAQIDKGTTEMFFYSLARPAEQVHEITVRLGGGFKNDPAARHEFLSIARQGAR